MQLLSRKQAFRTVVTFLRHCPQPWPPGLGKVLGDAQALSLHPGKIHAAPLPAGPICFREPWEKGDGHGNHRVPRAGRLRHRHRHTAAATAGHAA